VAWVLARGANLFDSNIAEYIHIFLGLIETSSEACSISLKSWNNYNALRSSYSPIILVAALNHDFMIESTAEWCI
jgi:hypothetical protein